MPAQKYATSRKEKTSTDFITKLQIVLVGYLNVGLSLERLKTRPLPLSESNIDPSLKEKNFYEHGLKLSTRFLGSDSAFAKKFEQHLEKTRKGYLITYFFKFFNWIIAEMPVKEFKIRSGKNLSGFISNIFNVSKTSRRQL